jgi:thiol:disulfide interchange protein DsbA
VLWLAFAAPAAAEPQEGRDYELVVPALARPDESKVVVMEFFSYACPHCYAFAPVLKSWEAELPDDVVLDRVAVAVGRQPWVLPAQLFYALRAMNKHEELDSAVFDAMHVERVDLATTRQVVDWAAAQGVDRAGFEAALGAFSVKSFVARGDQLAKAARIPGVPTLVVDGRYRVGIDTAGDLAAQLAIVDALIARARGDRKLSARQ